MHLSSGERVDGNQLLGGARRLRARLAERGGPELPTGTLAEIGLMSDVAHAAANGGGWAGSLRRLGDVLE